MIVVMFDRRTIQRYGHHLLIGLSSSSSLQLSSKHFTYISLLPVPPALLIYRTRLKHPQSVAAPPPSKSLDIRETPERLQFSPLALIVTGCAVTNDEAAYLYRPRTARRKILIPANTHTETYRKAWSANSVAICERPFPPSCQSQIRKNNKRHSTRIVSYGLQLVI
jgi:hypothetical protein